MLRGTSICFLTLAATLLALAIAFPAVAIEPWANKSLSVTNGLEIWLDASKEMAARGEATSKGPR